VDEYTRVNLAFDVGHSIKGRDVLDTLRRLFRLHGTPSHILSDSSSEIIGGQVKHWVESPGVDSFRHGRSQ